MKSDAAACGLLLLAITLAPAAALGQSARGTQRETRSAAQGLEREIGAVISRAGVSWIGYRVPMVAGPRQMCCYDAISSGRLDDGGLCRLEGGGISMRSDDGHDLHSTRVAIESPTEFLVLVRVENHAVVRVRTFTPDCDVDATGLSMVWLDDVKPDDSVAFLASLVAAAPENGDIHERVGKTVVAAIALHDAPAADRTLEGFVASTRPEWLRGDTAFWLGSTRGEPGARLLARMMAQEPSDKVRDKVTFGLSVSKSPLALAALIAAARDDRSTQVRGRALFWLAQKAGRDALRTIAGAIESDPDTGVKKRAVFALSQLPKDEGVPKLMEVARNNRNPEVRKQAMFWLGQSKDPRAVKFFEDILLPK